MVLYAACWIAVKEGAAEPVEESAYYRRVQGGPIGLPEVTDGRDV